VIADNLKATNLGLGPELGVVAAVPRFASLNAAKVLSNDDKPRRA
jgi:hypothetical protein